MYKTTKNEKLNQQNNVDTNKQTIKTKPCFKDKLRLSPCVFMFKNVHQYFVQTNQNKKTINNHNVQNSKNKQQLTINQKKN